MKNMNKKKLECVGTSFYLKIIFEQWYRLEEEVL